MLTFTVNNNEGSYRKKKTLVMLINTLTKIRVYEAKLFHAIKNLMNDLNISFWVLLQNTDLLKYYKSSRGRKEYLYHNIAVMLNVDSNDLQKIILTTE